MPQIGEIFSEGIEHVQRSFRRFSFKQRLKTAERMKRRTLQAIGETAWRLKLDEGSGCDAWGELERIDREIALVHEETAQRTEKLHEQMNQDREKQLEKEAADTTDIDLEDLTTQRATLLDEIVKYERSLKDSQGAERESVEAKLKDISSALSELDVRIKAIQEHVSQTSEKQHKLLQRAEELEKQERAAHADMAKREKELRNASEAHYRALGRQLLDNRPDRAELAPLYSRYDLVTATAETTLRSIENERRLIGMLDKESVIWFYGLVIGGSFAIAAIMVLLLLWLVPAIW